MFSCDNNHTFTESQIAMPHDSDDHDHTDGRCPECDGEVFEAVPYTDGSHGHMIGGILTDCDQVNVLLQKEDRVSVAFGDFLAKSVTLALLLLFGFMFIVALSEPDHISGRVSNDAEVSNVR